MAGPSRSRNYLPTVDGSYISSKTLTDDVRAAVVYDSPSSLSPTLVSTASSPHAFIPVLQQRDLPAPTPVRDQPRVPKRNQTACIEVKSVSRRPAKWQSHYRYLETCLITQELELNPLLRGYSAESSASPIRYSFLLPLDSATLTRTHQTLTEYEHSPATQPPVSELILIIPDRIAGHWSMLVSNPAGVSCHDVLSQLREALLEVVYDHETQWTCLSPSNRKQVQRAYHRNRAIAGNMIPQGLRRIDFLGTNLLFGGLTKKVVVDGLFGQRKRKFKWTDQEMTDEDREQQSMTFVVHLESLMPPTDPWYKTVFR